MLDWIKSILDNYTNGMYFPNIHIKDVIEILIVAVIVYEIMLWIKNTKAWMLLRGIIMLGVFILLAWIFQMHTILYLAAQSINVLAIAAVVETGLLRLHVTFLFLIICASAKISERGTGRLWE